MQNSRQWMVTQDWMVKGNRQTEWIEKRGKLIWLAFYFGGIGGGLYLISLFFDNLWGMLAGWLLAAVFKGIFNMLDLGKPSRAFRLAFNPQTSWLSRGLLFVAMFSGFGLIQLALSFLWPEQTLLVNIFKVLSGAFAIGVMIYSGFVLNRVKGIPSWNIFILPAQFFMWGLLGGFGLITLITMSGSNPNLYTVQAANFLFLIFNFILFGLHIAFAARNNDWNGQLADLFRSANNRVTQVLWSGIILISLAFTLNTLVLLFDLPRVFTGIVIFCEMSGSLLMTYWTLKSAVYTPLDVRVVTREKEQESGFMMS